MLLPWCVSHTPKTVSHNVSHIAPGWPAKQSWTGICRTLSPNNCFFFVYWSSQVFAIVGTYHNIKLSDISPGPLRRWVTVGPLDVARIAVTQGLRRRKPVPGAWFPEVLPWGYPEGTEMSDDFEVGYPSVLTQIIPSVSIPLSVDPGICGGTISYWKKKPKCFMIAAK